MHLFKSKKTKELENILISLQAKDMTERFPNSNEEKKVIVKDWLHIDVAENIQANFVIERENSYEWVMENKYNKTIEELKEIALANVYTRIANSYQGFPLCYNKESEIIYFLFDNYNFFASLILKEKFWEENGEMRELCGETGAILPNAEFAVAFPYRSLLAVGNANNPKSIEALKKFINEANDISKLLNPSSDDEIMRVERMSDEEWKKVSTKEWSGLEFDGLHMFEFRRWVTNDIFILKNNKWVIKK